MISIIWTFKIEHSVLSHEGILKISRDCSSQLLCSTWLTLIVLGGGENAKNGNSRSNELFLTFARLSKHTNSQQTRMV